MRGALSILGIREYPGRLIIIGKGPSGESTVVVYAITARSPSSQARFMELEGEVILVKPAGQALLKKGNPDLLLYPAVILGRGIAVSNGKQTTDIHKSLVRSQSAVEALVSGLSLWDYESDPPVFTPRIGGCVLPGKKSAALGIVKRAAGGTPLRHYFEIPLVPGKGMVISTYEGEDRDQLPPFRGEPFEVELEYSSARETAEAVYALLGPKEEGRDFRVSIACIFSKSFEKGQFEIQVKNRKEG